MDQKRRVKIVSDDIDHNGDMVRAEFTSQTTRMLRWSFHRSFALSGDFYHSSVTTFLVGHV